jgi:pimeloyl-ACP methyl ester carboxylesterase
MHLPKFLFASAFFLSTLTGYSQSTPFRTDTASVSVYGGKLFGTMFIPDRIDPPVVLIIAGSGATDRNGNTAGLPGKNNSLLQLADSLSRHGIASLRYDKRGIGESQRSLQREESLVFEQNSADARVWLQWLYEKGYRRIYVAGHSEGSMVALQAAQTFPLSGIISLAGAGRPIQEVLREQLSSLPDPMKSNAFNCLDTLSLGKRIKEPPIALFSLFRPAIQDYLISWMKLDPAKLIQTINCPALIVQGEQDIQVQVSDAKRLQEANPSNQLLIIPKMNHIFKSINDASRATNIASYTDPNQYVMTELIHAMHRFIRPLN